MFNELRTYLVLKEVIFVQSSLFPLIDKGAFVCDLRTF